jgi:hypothetical protein
MSNSVVGDQIRRDNLRIVDKVVISLDGHSDAGAGLCSEGAAVGQAR